VAAIQLRRLIAALGACVVLSWAVVLVARGGSIDQAQSSGNAGKTTLQGVYSAAQAGRGQKTYESICLSCHPLPTQTGGVFAKRWRGQTLADLYGYVAESMPKNDPGSLTPREIAQVVAYLLKINKMPAGAAELPANEAALGSIRIETK
jgi:mono/diheme cytochrome c family protein